MNDIKAAVRSQNYVNRLGLSSRGHEGQRKGPNPTSTPTWKLLIKPQTAHGI